MWSAVAPHLKLRALILTGLYYTVRCLETDPGPNVLAFGQEFPVTEKLGAALPMSQFPKYHRVRLRKGKWIIDEAQAPFHCPFP